MRYILPTEETLWGKVLLLLLSGGVTGSGWLRSISPHAGAPAASCRCPACPCLTRGRLWTLTLVESQMDITDAVEPR